MIILKIIRFLHYYTLPLAKFLLFLIMLMLIELVAPIRIFVTVYLVATFVIDVLKRIRARLTILCSKS